MGEVVALAFPSQGHLNAMLQLCRTLASHGCSVTLCNALNVHQQLMATIHSSTHANNANDCRRSGTGGGDAGCIGEEYSSGGKISYVGLSMYPEDESAPWDAADIQPDQEMEDIVPNFEVLGDNLHSFLQEKKKEQSLLHGCDYTPPPGPSCIISDVLLSTTTQRVADLHGLPRIALLPFPQTFNLLYFLKIPLPQSLHDKLQDDGDTSIVPLACNMPPIQSYCLPTFFHKVDITKIMNEMFLKQFEALDKAERVLVNSFCEIEELAIKAIPNIYPIGPLLDPMSNQKHMKRKSLWLEEGECLKWLDNQPHNSVIYVSFGSITLISKLQMQELATGLEESGYRLLIVFRPKLIDDDSNAIGSEFFSNTLESNTSFIVTWAPQLQVLSHPSIGAFLTHCGWNSIIESIWHGVPMLCFPYFCDQMLNAHLVVDIWRIGTSLKCKENEFVPREKVKKMVRLLMEENEGKFIRTRITNIKEVARRNTMEGGISWKNIQSLIEMINGSHNSMVGILEKGCLPR